MRKALIFQGGWDGHEPLQVAQHFQSVLEKEGFQVVVSDTLDCLKDKEGLLAYDLLVPVWTMGEIEDGFVNNVSEAVAQGVGLAGCHGGMCDAFRQSVLWQFMTGGNWVSHPGGDGVTYTVNIMPSSSSLVEDIEDFKVTSEQYYLHVDPAVQVLATTDFPIAEGHHTTNGVVRMPVAWTKRWGQGRVYYNSLGHHAETVEIDEVSEMMRRGFLWAAAGKSKAVSKEADNKEG
ncbi:ThuA domain-containing protein [Vallitalea pronyensis]|uniref:ThuA domain-containing protein n=1 Tax=Vallitalea pronyensis TaxID=1348613 RepID=A0A8J8MMW6_9FIRM|nr:ThuA domain-containing protein [Vallitalea pronyensis]QUI24183.1 ThuA domain-containing protein [Vallitalea pronyensis]